MGFGVSEFGEGFEFGSSFDGEFRVFVSGTDGSVYKRGFFFIIVDKVNCYDDLFYVFEDVLLIFGDRSCIREGVIYFFVVLS